MLASTYDPVRKKVIFGKQAGAQNDASATLPEISVGPPAAAQPAPAPNAGGGMMKQPLGAFYNQLETERGLPQGYLAKTRAVESGNGTNLVNPNSSARGDFQFIRSTAKQFGLTDPMDPYASARAAADLAKQNMDGIVAKTGQTPTGGELYAAHQQGLGGYLALRNGRGTGSAEMGLNGGAGMSPSGFLAKTIGRFDNAKVANLDGFVPPPSPGANQGQGPTMAAAAAQTASGVPAVSSTPAPDNTYKGGLLGLAGIGDENAPGMSKDVWGKLGDMAGQPGGGAIGGAAKALGAMLGAGQQQSSAPGITLQTNTEAHAGDPSLMAYLDPRRRRPGYMGA